MIVNCTVVDGTDRPAQNDAGIHIEGNRIRSIGQVDDLLGEAKDAKVIDLVGAYVTPGLMMSMHVHLGLSLPGAAGLALSNETLPQLTLRMAGNARGGVTCRDYHCSSGRRTRIHRFSPALRAAIGRAEVEVADLHRWPLHRMHRRARHWSGRAIEADGPAEFRKAVRTQIKHGADLIKLMLTGGVAGEHEGMDTAQAPGRRVASRHRGGASMGPQGDRARWACRIDSPSYRCGPGWS